MGLRLEAGEEVLSQARALDGAASPRYRLGDTRSRWLSNKGGTSCPQKHLFFVCGGGDMAPFYTSSWPSSHQETLGEGI